ncbi:MAG: hypothetical protein ACYSU0_16510 [Planctomycetota bacterium]|jgi:hypothetical protein
MGETNETGETSETSEATEATQATQEQGAGGRAADTAAAAVAAGKIEELTRVANRRKQAFEKLKAGKPSAVGERRMRKLLKRAQRRKDKFLADQARRAGKKPAEA